MQLLAFFGVRIGYLYLSSVGGALPPSTFGECLQALLPPRSFVYITTFNNFAKTCEDLDVCILEITEVQAADILVTLQLQKREDPALGSSADNLH